MDFKTLSVWGAVTTSIISMLTFSAVLVVAFFYRDGGLLNMVIGVAAANATATVQYWIGSSSGSQKKDERPSGTAP